MSSTATDQGRWSARSAKWIAIVALAASARADVVVLKDGRRVEGTVVSENADKIQIDTRGGRLELARADVASIERSASKERELADRKAQAKTAEDFYQIGAWAEKQKLTQDAKKCMLRAIELDPAHAPIW